MSTQPVLEVENLAIQYKIGTEWKTAVKDISFTIDRCETFGLVGESGCGKTTVAMAIMHYLPRNGRVSGGSIRLNGREFTNLSPKELRKARVNEISMVYQDPGSALNPSIRVGAQIADVFDLTGGRG
jgi:peptide/nickel transport system ATP-binding protein